MLVSFRRMGRPLLILALMPVAPALAALAHAPAPPVFAAGVATIAVLADSMRHATEQLADHVGPAIGGLVNVSFGSLAELILAFFVLMSGDARGSRPDHGLDHRHQPAAG